ncbi:MAG TPA: hypothetical protein VMT28_01565 [Terriglobales bacterium]|jgi:hypothetical protein|nr:hypothetical protein [Terriglobales bacterium]
MPQKGQSSGKRNRPPRIRVPNHERALFTVDDCKFVGVIQRLSLTGGSAILTKGPIPQGTLGMMGLNTVFGTVTAQIEFLQTGADGVHAAQAFRFLAMDSVSAERFAAAAKQMENAGFSDAEDKERPLGLASASVSKVRDSIRRLSATISSARPTGQKR